jgi:hypothetical protein
MCKLDRQVALEIVFNGLPGVIGIPDVLALGTDWDEPLESLQRFFGGLELMLKLFKRL